jgi:hypothetical protein
MRFLVVNQVVSKSCAQTDFVRLKLGKVWICRTALLQPTLCTAFLLGYLVTKLLQLEKL